MRHGGPLHLVRTTSLEGYDRLARSLRLDPETMLRRAGIPPEYLGDSTLYITQKALFSLLESSAAQSGAPSFGAELGQIQGPAILGPIAYLMRSSATVAEAFRNLSRYFHLHNTGADVRIDIRERIGQIGYDVKASPSVAVSQGVELAVAIGHRILRTLAGEQLPVRECVFRHAPLYGIATYRRLFGTSPRHWRTQHRRAIAPNGAVG
jgi:hypothetical protein